MSVIATDQWLLDSYNKPIEICDEIKGYFHDVSAIEIYDYLSMHGMYHPIEKGIEHLKALQKNNVWNMIEKEYQSLQKEWEGTDIPIFIFPSDTSNTRLKKVTNGKSGLAFKDKLFLFISEQNTEKELKALITHEYNHVCRLTKFKKEEKDYVLLDTIILEGLAEYAVFERLGADCLATWTSYYSDQELIHMWKNLIYRNRNVPKFDFTHQKIIYGLDSYPEMLGYCIGYFLVKNYLETYNFKSKELLGLEADTIAQLTFS